MTLPRERLNLDALAPNRSAAVKDHISGRITRLSVGDADKPIFPDNGEPGSHLESARKDSHFIKEVFNKGPDKFIALNVRPGSVLFAGRTVAV